MKNNAARQRLATYPVSVEILTRFSDVDPNNHINNVAVAEYYQESRLGFHHALNPSEIERLRDTRTLVARHEMDFLAEIDYPGRVWVGVGVARIGNRSYVLASGMFQGERCVGLANTVLVHANAGGTLAIEAPMRALLERKLLPAEALA